MAKCRTGLSHVGVCCTSTRNESAVEFETAHFVIRLRQRWEIMSDGRFRSQGPRVILLLIVFLVLVWAVFALNARA